jgi:hypothetical protein
VFDGQWKKTSMPVIICSLFRSAQASPHQRKHGDELR